MQNVIPDWAKGLTIYEVNIRQYTPEGTLKAFAEHLPRLKELGAGILWFMPIQPIGEEKRKGSKGSNYSIKDYTAIHPDYGTMEDFQEIVKQAHDLGMYVILDWVANHTAWDHVWRKSHPEYYTKDNHGNFMAPVPEWEDVMKLDYSNRAMRSAMQEAMRYWVKNAHIDGFRCDMAHLLPTDFWEETRETLEKEKTLFMLAESEQKYLLRKAFSVEYSWEFHHMINAIAREEKGSQQLYELVKHEILEYPSNAAPMLFTSNHDENSWNGSAPERLGFALEPLNALTFTLNGAPMIYNGQEAGLSKRLPFFEKDTISWKEDKMFPFYQKLIQLKKENPALWSPPFGGEFVKIPTEADHQVFAFARVKEAHRVIVVLNLSYHLADFHLQMKELKGDYHDIFTNKQVALKDVHPTSLSPWKYLIYTT